MAQIMKKRTPGVRRRTRSVGSMPFSWQQKPNFGVHSDEMGASSSTSKDKGFYQSDSDDISGSVQSAVPYDLYSSPKFTENANNMESDSVNENTPCRFSVRRKRKFKKLAMDVDVPNNGRYYAHCLSKFHKNKQRLFFKHPSGADSRFWQVAGKRKRALRDKGLVLSAAGRSSPSRESKVLALSKLSLNDEPATQDDMMEVSYGNLSSSSISSSSSEAGIFTNDEGREGDDEQSDWIGDSGMAGFKSSMISIRGSDHCDDSDLKLNRLLGVAAPEDNNDTIKSSDLRRVRDSDIRNSRRRGRIFKPNFAALASAGDKGETSCGLVHGIKSVGTGDVTLGRRHTFSGFKKRKRVSSMVLDSVTDMSSIATHELSNISSSDSGESEKK